MFHFSIRSELPVDATADQMAANGITEDADFGQRLDEIDQDREDERIFRAENETPRTVPEAIEFVQGTLFTTPLRVWIDGQPHLVTAADVEQASQPST